MRPRKGNEEMPLLFFFFSPTNGSLGFPFCVSLGVLSGRHHRFLLIFCYFKKALPPFLVIMIHFHILRSTAQSHFKISILHLIQSGHIPPKLPGGDSLELGAGAGWGREAWSISLPTVTVCYSSFHPGVLGSQSKDRGKGQTFVHGQCYCILVISRVFLLLSP